MDHSNRHPNKYAVEFVLEIVQYHQSTGKPMGEKTFKVIESDDGGFEACVFGHSIYTFGEE